MCLVCLIKAEEFKSSQEKRINAEEEEDDFDKKSEVQAMTIADDVAVHYFAIGSMTNSVALSLRDLSPISSKPAMLMGYRMVFRGSGGMASAEPIEEYEPCATDAAAYPFDCIHGVLHLLTAADMRLLDEYEGGYVRRQCKVTLYNGTTHIHAFVYQMLRTSWHPGCVHELPSERYLDIISKGCSEHGVREGWIEFIRNHRNIPRTCPSQFRTFHVDTVAVPLLTWELVRRMNGHDSTKMWIVINNLVLEFAGK
jgi:hypothetical protein